MNGPYECCPRCEYSDLAPRKILVGSPSKFAKDSEYQEIITLKCQHCGWLGEQPCV